MIETEVVATRDGPLLGDNLNSLDVRADEDEDYGDLTLLEERKASGNVDRALYDEKGAADTNEMTGEFGGRDLTLAAEAGKKPDMAGGNEGGSL